MFKIVIIVLFLFCNSSFSQVQKNSASSNSNAINVNKSNINTTYNYNYNYNLKEKDVLNENLSNGLYDVSIERVINNTPIDEKNEILKGNFIPAIKLAENKKDELKKSLENKKRNIADYSFQIAILYYSTDKNKAINNIEEAVSNSPENFLYNLVLIYFLLNQGIDINNHPSYKKCLQLIEQNQNLDKYEISWFYVLDAAKYFHNLQFTLALEKIALSESFIYEELNVDKSERAIELNIRLLLVKEVVILIKQGKNFDDLNSFFDNQLKNINLALSTNCKKCGALLYTYLELKLLKAEYSLENKNYDELSKNISSINLLILNNNTILKNLPEFEVIELKLEILTLKYNHYTIKDNNNSQTLIKDFINKALSKKEINPQKILILIEALDWLIDLDNLDNKYINEINVFKNIIFSKIITLNYSYQEFSIANIYLKFALVQNKLNDKTGAIASLKSAKNLLTSKNIISKNLGNYKILHTINFYLYLFNTNTDQSFVQLDSILKSWQNDYDLMFDQKIDYSTNANFKAEIMLNQASYNATYVSCESSRLPLDQSIEIYVNLWRNNAFKNLYYINQINKLFDIQNKCSPKKQDLNNILFKKYYYSRVDYLNGNNQPDHIVFQNYDDLHFEILNKFDSEQFVFHERDLSFLAQNCSTEDKFKSQCNFLKGNGHFKIAMDDLRTNNVSASRLNLSLASEYYNIALINSEINDNFLVNRIKFSKIWGLMAESYMYPKYISRNELVDIYINIIKIYNQLNSNLKTQNMENWIKDATMWIDSDNNEPFSKEQYSFFKF